MLLGLTASALINVISGKTGLNEKWKTESSFHFSQYTRNFFYFKHDYEDIKKRSFKLAARSRLLHWTSLCCKVCSVQRFNLSVDSIIGSCSSRPPQPICPTKSLPSPHAVAMENINKWVLKPALSSDVSFPSTLRELTTCVIRSVTAPWWVRSPRGPETRFHRVTVAIPTDAQWRFKMSNPATPTPHVSYMLTVKRGENECMRRVFTPCLI